MWIGIIHLLSFFIHLFIHFSGANEKQRKAIKEQQIKEINKNFDVYNNENYNNEDYNERFLKNRIWMIKLIILN